MICDGCDNRAICIFADWLKNHTQTKLVTDNLLRIEAEAEHAAKECPPAPHSCFKCEILYLAREALGHPQDAPKSLPDKKEPRWLREACEEGNGSYKP